MLLSFRCISKCFSLLRGMPMPFCSGGGGEAFLYQLFDTLTTSILLIIFSTISNHFTNKFGLFPTSKLCFADKVFECCGGSYLYHKIRYAFGSFNQFFLSNSRFFICMRAKLDTTGIAGRRRKSIIQPKTLPMSLDYPRIDVQFSSLISFFRIFAYPCVQ